MAALAPESDSQFYNLACARAKLGDPDAAFAALDRTFANGWTDVDHIRTDEDLASLRDDPRLDDLIERIEAWVENEPERNRTYHDIPEPADAEVFDSAEAIGEASTTIAEPALIAVALKAEQLSAGGISAWGLRLAVAFGVAVGISLGVLRIILDIPLQLFFIAGYAVVIVQTLFAPRLIVPLAYDSGGVTTSTVTVPLVAAMGLGLAESLPGRSPLIDGFGLIAFASLFPMITVMAYAQASEWLEGRRRLESDPEATSRVQSEEDRS